MKAYAIKDPKGKIYANTVSSTEDGAVNSFQNVYSDSYHNFHHYLKRGYRCVPVEITEIKYE